jgi:tRNA pseudouridine55 synthase
MDQASQEGKMLLIDKPYGWTSFGVVKKLRGALGVKKIGHAGTLDPLATGLLILCTGKMTKKIHEYQDMEKEYQGRLVLGKTTPSIDLETEFDSNQDISHLTPSQVLGATERFVGEIQQIPPVYSAVKVDGQRVYNKARKGEQVALKPRLVQISEFSIINCNLPEVTFKVVCSKGTYIRSLVRDFGELLQTGAYLADLTRTRIGLYTLSEALQLKDLVRQTSTDLK